MGKNCINNDNDKYHLVKDIVCGKTTAGSVSFTGKSTGPKTLVCTPVVSADPNTFAIWITSISKVGFTVKKKIFNSAWVDVTNDGNYAYNYLAIWL